MVKISVTVTDIDDNPPQFESDELVFYVKEDSPVGSTVATLHAVDPDEDGNSNVNYKLEMDIEMMNIWALDSLTGELSPIVSLDYETRVNYTLVVTAISNSLLSQVIFILILNLSFFAQKSKKKFISQRSKFIYTYWTSMTMHLY